jgi:sec-independent protein translocase protein TatB
MLGVGLPELVLIAGVALVVVGPERLPRVMRELGRWYGQLRRAADELRRAFTLEADRQDASERYKQLQERRKKAQESRKRAEEERKLATGAVAQTAEPVQAAAPTGDPTTGPTEEGAVVPNDVPPDEPHPRTTSTTGEA